MNKTLIIIQREFSVRIKKKSFIILTILMPFLMAALIFGPVLLSGIKGNEEKKVAVIDMTGKYAPLLKNKDDFHFEKVGAMSKKFQSDDSPYTAVIYITGDLSRDSSAVTIYSQKEVPMELTEYFNRVISEQIRAERMASYKIPGLNKIIDNCKVDFDARTVKWDKEGNAKVSSSEIASVVGIVFTLLIYMFVLTYGGMVMQGVMEEKTNRIVELMVSSVKPHQLMLGKITGIALVGLFQFLIWGVMLFSLLAIAGSVMGLATGVAAASPVAGAAAAQTIAMPTGGGAEFLQILQGMNLLEIAILFVFYFIGGYLLFASIFAAVGASINEQEDSQQFMLPIILLMIFALYAGMFSAQNPDGPLAMWCSYIPFTSPIVMMVRLPFGVPAWQIVLSLVILYVSALAIVWVSSKIYRVGILMYGKKPSLKEMIKWIRYK